MLKLYLSHEQTQVRKKENKICMKVACPKCGIPLIYDTDRSKMTCLNKQCEGYKK